MLLASTWSQLGCLDYWVNVFLACPSPQKYIWRVLRPDLHRGCNSPQVRQSCRDNVRDRYTKTLHEHKFSGHRRVSMLLQPANCNRCRLCSSRIEEGRPRLRSQQDHCLLCLGIDGLDSSGNHYKHAEWNISFCLGLDQNLIWKSDEGCRI